MPKQNDGIQKLVELFVCNKIKEKKMYVSTCVC